MPQTLLVAIDARRTRFLPLLGALLCSLPACSSSSETGQTELPFSPVSSALDHGDAGRGPSASDPSATASSGGAVDGGSPVVIEVPSDASVCGANLPFKPPGCGCNVGETAACWTGPADRRLVGMCRDGVQKCVPTAEFGVWGPCEGEVLDCGEPPPKPPEECKCKPGAVVGCDEDCTAFVFCAPFSTKVCQPDGKFGPCRESLLPSADYTAICLNVFNGCLPGNPEGVYTGDCDSVFTCNHPPGAPPPAAPPAMPPAVPQ